MWQKEGFKGMLKGNGVNVIRIAPFSAFEFFFYDLYKYHIFGGSTASVPDKLICGGLTGMSASFLTYPLDYLRTVIGVKVVEANGKQPTILGTAKEVFKVQGVMGFYKGCRATMYVSKIKIMIQGITPYVGFKMASFDIMKTYVDIGRDHPKAQIYNFCLGGIAGTVSVTITYPTDVIRRKL